MTDLALHAAAESFVRTCYSELNKSEDEIDTRLAAISTSIKEHGTYEHTTEELMHGARMAWRNSNRCIGRLFWESLQVFDKRHLVTPAEIAVALIDHIIWATNGGRIRPTITLLKPQQGDSSVRVWNHQLLRYAGYETDNGIVGDPHSLQFTKVCQSLGWQGDGTTYDILPLVVSVDGGQPQWFPLPKEAVLEVPITHVEYPKINDLELRWYAVPIISDMKLEIGGITYTAAPFNGWYMGTEIGARNLADETRYNMLPAIAQAMGLSTERASSLWKDRALVELNTAVLESFKLHGVSIVDHHTAAIQFHRFEEREQASGREVTGRWSWLIPPLSPATTGVFHRSYEDKLLSPNYAQQAKPYEAC
jgi:nitric-oxide synthase